MKKEHAYRKEIVKKYFKNALYGITCFEHSRSRGNIVLAAEMLAAGIKIIQYREKYRMRRIKYEECLYLRRMTRAHKALFIINDDVDLALICAADGLHIGQEDIPIQAARKILKTEQFIGVSTHSPVQAHKAWQKGADYIGAGPVFETRTKENVSQAVGVSYIEYVAAHSPVPFVAIGGIKANNISDVLKAGADCVALVTEITCAENVQGKIHTLREMIEQKKPEIIHTQTS